MVASNEMVAPKKMCMLVGNFLTEKNIYYNAMQNVMAGLWRPNEGMEVHDMGGSDIHLYSSIKWIFKR